MLLFPALGFSFLITLCSVKLYQAVDIDSFCRSKSDYAYSYHKKDVYVECRGFNKALDRVSSQSYPYSEYELWLESMENK